jgi:hypothetical protein
MLKPLLAYRRGDLVRRFGDRGALGYASRSAARGAGPKAAQDCVFPINAEVRKMHHHGPNDTRAMKRLAWVLSPGNGAR